MKTDLEIIAEQCAEIDRRNGEKPLSPVRVKAVVRRPWRQGDKADQALRNAIRKGLTRHKQDAWIKCALKWIRKAQISTKPNNGMDGKAVRDE